GVILLIAVADTKNEGLTYLAGAVIAMGVLVAIYLLVRAALFCTALIIDRNCGPVEAIQGSWRLTEGHFWGWLGVGLLLGLINMAGALLCGFGLLFTLPFTELVLAAGYLMISYPRPPIESMPP